tara:strand:- start:438 stop:794 length:357 start_codon:yes stop_codon:yes gene_type:complete
MPHRFAETPNLPVSGANWQKQKLTISKTAVKQSSGRPLVTGLNKLERGDCCQPDTKKQAEKSTPTGRMKSDALPAKRPFPTNVPGRSRCLSALVFILQDPPKKWKPSSMRQYFQLASP